MKQFGGIWTTCFSGLLVLQLLGSTQSATLVASCQLLSRPFGPSMRVLVVSEFHSRVAAYTENTAIICENIASSSDVDFAEGRLRELSHPGRQLGIFFERCNLDAFPANFLASFEVSHLAFYECEMSAIPYDLINSEHDTLRLLWTISGPVPSRTIKGGGFQYNPKMEEVWFVDSGIESVEGEAFCGFSNLNELALIHNKIQSLTNSAFECLTKLEKLSINNNEIRNLDEDVFGKLMSLEILDITSNRLTKLSDGILDPLKKLKMVFLQGNNLHCDCDLQWLQDWFRSSYEPLWTSDYPSCSTPVQGDLKTLKFCNSGRPVKKTKNKTKPRDSSINGTRPSLSHDQTWLIHVVPLLFIILCNLKMIFL